VTEKAGTKERRVFSLPQPLGKENEWCRAQIFDLAVGGRPSGQLPSFDLMNQTGGRKARPYGKSALLRYISTRRGDPCGRPAGQWPVTVAAAEQNGRTE